MNNGRNLYDFDGVIYRGNCSFDFFMYCLTYYPCPRQANIFQLNYKKDKCSLDGGVNRDIISL